MCFQCQTNKAERTEYRSQSQEGDQTRGIETPYTVVQSAQCNLPPPW